MSEMRRHERTASYLLPDPGGAVARQLLDEIERLEAALHFIAAWGGKRTEEGVNASGTWCAEQARSALRGGEGE